MRHTFLWTVALASVLGATGFATAVQTANKAFHDAARLGDAEDVRRMLAATPALARSVEECGFTALHAAADGDERDVATLLLDAGADPNAKNDDGITPLHLASSVRMVDLLVRRGANVDSRATDGATPLLTQASEDGRLASLEALLRLGANAAATNAAGESASSIARAREEPEKVALLGRYLRKKKS